MMVTPKDWLSPYQVSQQVQLFDLTESEWWRNFIAQQKIGECLTDESDLTKSKASKSYNSWMQQLASQSLNLGVPTVIKNDQ
jgi:hypothetical protein